MNARRIARQTLRLVVASPLAAEGNGHDQCIVSNCPCRTLHPRQRQVLHCLMHGFSEKETATAMGSSINTVHCHVTAIYRHFAVRSRAELLARMLVMVMREVAEEVRAGSASLDSAAGSRGVLGRSPDPYLRRRA